LQPKSGAKAELNRRSQICDVLAGTGVRVAKMACPPQPQRKIELLVPDFYTTMV
jgi:hypothetical protein